MTTKKCSRCNGEMEDGFIMDRKNQGLEPSEWVEGRPEYSVLSGTKINEKRRFRIRSYRCTICGFLELYA